MTDSVFDTVLSIEDTPEILEFAVPGHGLLLWPYVRRAILSHCLERSFPGKYFPSSSPETPSSRYALFVKMILNTLHTLRPWPKRAVWHYSAVRSAYYKQRNGRLYNMYTEPLAECLPRETLLLDASWGSAFIPAVGPYALRRVQPLRIVAKLTRFVSPAKYQGLVADFFAWLEERIQCVLGLALEPDFMRESAERLCGHTIPYAITAQHLFSFFLKKKTPRLLLIDDAFYGNYGHLTLPAKEHGVLVAEMQHGMVFREHQAYSWADAMRASPILARQLPDYFLSYGAYWHDGLRLPFHCRLQVIGNPWFAMQAASQPALSGTGVLFALNAFYEDFAPIIEAVVRAFPGRTVIVRPHPTDHQIFYASIAAAIPGIQIDTSKDIYDTFPMVDTVIGELSTSLFEAGALGKRVFSRLSSLTRGVTDRIFEQYENAADLVEKLHQPWPEALKGQLKTLFERNWQENYRRFVAAIREQ